jgi:hypothetical protein
MVVNFVPKNSITFVLNMGLKNNSLHLTIHSRMDWLNGGTTLSFQLQSGNIFHIDEILYVPGLKKNLISIAMLERKGYSIDFTKGKALMWPCYDC